MDYVDQLLIRPNPQQGESLSGHIIRMANANYINPHELWRFINIKKHYPQSDMSTIIDLSPDSIDTETLMDLSGLNHKDIEKLTLLPYVSIVYGQQNTISLNNRNLSNVLSTNLRYCPLCLFENLYYKLIWRVLELTRCTKHHVLLIDTCPFCSKQIPLLPANSFIGICPFCNSELTASPVIKNNEKTSCIEEDWLYLFESDKTLTLQPGNISQNQYLALKLLHALSVQKEFFLHTDLLTSIDALRISTLLQMARASCKRNLHFNIILSVLRQLEISLEQFLNEPLPVSFIESVLHKPMKMTLKYSCQAPWCSSFNISGSLKRTATSTKKQKSGKHLNYYLICDKCGTKYAINHNTKELEERGYFIDLAYKKVRGLALTGYSKKAIINTLSISKDVALRCLIFLISNNLIDRQLYNIGLPSTPEPKVISAFKNVQKESGVRFKDLIPQLKLSYSQFLYYSYLPEVRASALENQYIKPLKNEPYMLQERLIKILSDYVKHPAPITIKRVSEALNVCPETLRLHGLYQTIAEFKEQQKCINDTARAEEIKQKSKEMMLQLKNTQIEAVTSKQIYNLLAVNRTVLVRKHPDITKFISQELKKVNKH